MHDSDFEPLALDLLEATMNIATVHKVSASKLLEKHSGYSSHSACIAYAFQYGMKSAFDAWTILRKGPINSKVGNITILGGGCCFELPVLLHHLKDQTKEIYVKVIDPVSQWKVFQPMHVRLAERMGIRLHLDYVPVIDLLEQIDSYKTDLLVCFNSLEDLSFGERKSLRIAYANCNRHLIWHQSLTVMQEVFGASYIPMRDEFKYPTEELCAFLSQHYPEFAKLKPFANFGDKGFYLIHNLTNTKNENALKWASKF